MLRHPARHGIALAAILILTATHASAKEVKKAIKLYEAPGSRRQKTEHTATISCKRENGTIVKPATLTYKQEGDCCTIDPASGTESKTGTWKVTFKYKSAGTCKITFECGGGEKLILNIESIAKPKSPITGQDQEDDDSKPEEKARGNDDSKQKSVPPDSDTFAGFVETQDAQVEAFLAILSEEHGSPDTAGHINRLIGLLIPSPLLDLDPGILFKAVEELDALPDGDAVRAEWLPATELALDAYSAAVTRYFQSGDCNLNGLADYEDLANGTSTDIDGDFVIDDCDCGRVVFDADGDGDVDQSDFGAFQACTTPPGLPPELFNDLPLSCRCMDVAVGGIEPDGAIDQLDLKVFLACVTGPAISVESLDVRCDGR